MNDIREPRPVYFGLATLAAFGSLPLMIPAAAVHHTTTGRERVDSITGLGFLPVYLIIAPSVTFLLVLILVRNRRRSSALLWAFCLALGVAIASYFAVYWLLFDYINEGFVTRLPIPAAWPGRFAANA